MVTYLTDADSQLRAPQFTQAPAPSPQPQAPSPQPQARITTPALHWGPEALRELAGRWMEGCVPSLGALGISGPVSICARVKMGPGSLWGAGSCWEEGWGRPVSSAGQGQGSRTPVSTARACGGQDTLCGQAVLWGEGRVAATEHLATGGADPGPQSWGLLKKQEKREKRESRKQKRHPEPPVTGKTSCQLHTPWEPGPLHGLGTGRPASRADYRIPRSSPAGQGTQTTSLLLCQRSAGRGTWRGGDAWERLGGLTRASPPAPSGGRGLQPRGSSRGPSAGWPSLSPRKRRRESGAGSPSPLRREAGRLN